MTDFSPPTGPPDFDASPSAADDGATGGLSPDHHQPASASGGSSGTGGSRLWLFAIIAIVVGVGAIAFAGRDTSESATQQLESSASTPASTAPGSTAPGPSATPQQSEPQAPTTPQGETTAPQAAPAPPEGGAQTAAVTISGAALDPMPNVGGPTTPDTDSAIGQIAPTLVGFDFDGNQIPITPDGRPKAVYFLAHWCPHCQVEVPTIQGLIDAGIQPEDLDIYAVSTAVSAGRGNYPPQAWLEDERWSSPVMLDSPDSSALISYGAGGFPFVVFLDGENRVLTRASGEMPAELMQQVWEAVAAS